MIEAIVKGGNEVADAFDELGRMEKNLAKRELRSALRKRMSPLREQARMMAPYKSGRLYRAIKVKAWTRAGKGETGVKLIIDPGRSRTDRNGAYYGWMIEFGRLAGNRYIPGRYMLKQAYELMGEDIGAYAALDVEAVVDAAIKRHKKNARAGNHDYKGLS